SSGARHRFANAHAQEQRCALGNRRVHAVRTLHAVDRRLAGVSGMGVDPVRDLSLRADPAEVAKVDADARFGGRGPVVLAPTSRWASKRWPAAKWVELARRLLGRGFGPVAVVGGPGERDQCAPLLDLAASDSRVVDLVGQTSVGGLMAVISRARLVVANDSAAAHMTVGFDRPLVALYGPTRTRLVGPYGRDADVIQRVLPGDDLDHKRDKNVSLMERIGVGEVFGACLTRLAR
ncbi:MAG: glycosyltransferase family 9 protein, partial [Planctomycetota bacterium]